MILHAVIIFLLFGNSKSFVSNWNSWKNDEQKDYERKDGDPSNYSGGSNNFRSNYEQRENENDFKIHFPSMNESKDNSTTVSEDTFPDAENFSCGIDVPRRIIGGTSADIDEFPWLALLQYFDPATGKISHDCSGTLISKRFVLTAAHCTNGLGISSRNLKLRKVKLGEWDVSTTRDCQGEVCSSPTQEIDVEEVIPHEKYNPRGKSQAHDIALVKLRGEATLNQYVQPICLPDGDIGSTDYEGKKLTVSGWGKTSNARNSNSNLKMKVDLPIVSWEDCRTFYESFYGGLKISKTQFCAGGEDGKDSCQGDSGGPLMTTEKKNNEMYWYMIGIVSSGPAACGVESRPSLYTNVSQYMPWIVENIKNERLKQ